MAFQYPLASKSILEGNEFYRIKRLAYEGDSETIFGSFIGIDVGFNALAVGPDSSFDNYQCFYPDPLVEGGIALANFSVGAPFVATVAPDASSPYQNAYNVPKLAYVRPTQALILDPTTAAGTSGDLEIPVMDMIAYTGRLPPAFPMERSVLKKQGFFRTTATVADNGHVITGFGRKSFTANVVNNSAVAVDVVIYGVMIGDPELIANPFGVAEKHELLASTAVASGGGSLSFPHSAVQDGYFDYYLLIATSASPTLPSNGSATAVYISMEVQD